MTSRTARYVATVVVTYLVSTALFVDGLPTPDDGVVSLASEDAHAPDINHSAVVGEDVDGGINPNLVDLGEVLSLGKQAKEEHAKEAPANEAPAKEAPTQPAPAKQAAANATAANVTAAKEGSAKAAAAPQSEHDASTNPLRRFGTAVIVKQVESKAEKKVRKAKEKQHKADVKVSHLKRSLQRAEDKETKASQATTEAASDAKDQTEQAHEQAAKKEKQRATKEAKKKQELKTRKRMLALAAEQKAEALDKKNSRITSLLHREQGEKAAEQKYLMQAKESANKEFAKPKLPKHQQAALVSTPGSHGDTAPPPADGLTDTAKVPDPTMKAQTAAMNNVKRELKPNVHYDLMESEGRAADEKASPKPVHEHRVAKQQKHKKHPVRQTPRATHDEPSCFTAGECNPDSCLCRKGKPPIPLAKARAAGLLNNRVLGSEDQSCLNKAGECDPEACLCKAGQPPVPLHHKRTQKHTTMQPSDVHTAGNKDQSCLNKAGECDPEACLCKAGQPPVPLNHERTHDHTTTKPSEVRLGAEGPKGKSTPKATPALKGKPAPKGKLAPAIPSKGIKAGQYEKFPQFQNHKFSEADAKEESFAEKAVSKYTHFSHPDKYEKKIEAGGAKAVAMAHNIFEEMGKATEDEKAGQKWDQAAQMELKAGNVEAERKDADKAWGDMHKFIGAMQKVPDMARAEWPQKEKFRLPKMEIDSDGLPLKNPHFAEKQTHTSLPKGPKETSEEALARKVAFQAEIADGFTASRKKKPVAERFKLQKAKGESDAHFKMRQDTATGNTAKFVHDNHIKSPQKSAELLISEDETHHRHRSIVEELKTVAARGAAAIGLAAGHEEKRLALDRRITKTESRALGEAAKQTKRMLRRKTKQLAEREEKLKKKEGVLQGQAAAQREIFKVQQKSEARLASEVKSASQLGKLEREKTDLAQKKAALDAQAATQSAIFKKQMHNSNALKAEVNVVGRAEKSALANAVKLGEVKAHAEDQAHIILAAKAQRRKEKDDAKNSKWTMKHTAALGKLMVVTREVDKQLARKKQHLQRIRNQLTLLHKQLTHVADGNEKLQTEDHSIRESTEEMSREELGEGNGDEEENDLGESMDTNQGSSEDDLSVTLAQMSAKFDSIQRTMDSAAKQETAFEHHIAATRVTKEKTLKHKVARDLRKKHEKQIHLHSTKKQRMLEKKLEKEEARLRMTTSAKVHAQVKLENAVDDERAEKGKEARKLRGAVSRLTPQQETRLEYQRMYVQNAMQQAQQRRDDLENQLSDIKGNDARKLKQLTLDIRHKREVLKDDLDRVQTLASDYERDHDMGEGLSSEHGAKPLSDEQAKQEAKDIQDESHVSDVAHTLAQRLANMEDDTQAPLVRSAKSLLGMEHGAKSQLGESSEISATDTDGVEGSRLGATQIHLAAKISMAKTALKLKLDAFAELQKKEERLRAEADHLQQSATAARNDEYDAQTRTAAMRGIVKHLSDSIDRHEESMELGETLFSKKRKEKDEDMDESDLGESSDTASKPDLPPIQAELNYEHEKLAQAEAQIRHLAKDGPKIVKDQIAVDKKRYGTVLKKEEANLNKLHKRFSHAAAMLSPKIKSQQLLEDAVRDEESRQQDYSHDLDNIANYAGMVDDKSKAAAKAARELYESRHGGAAAGVAGK